MTMASENRRRVTFSKSLQGTPFLILFNGRRNPRRSKPTSGEGRDAHSRHHHASRAAAAEFARIVDHLKARGMSWKAERILKERSVRRMLKPSSSSVVAEAKTRSPRIVALAWGKIEVEEAGTFGQAVRDQHMVPGSAKSARQERR
jgi:hypothetical protein